MKRKLHRRTVIVPLGLLACCSVALAQTEALLEETVVTASRSAQTVFDAPGSIDLVTREQIERAGPQINISEALSTIPGINVADRNNYAQDLQISIRGFGSRAPFGVRGVRLMVDGLPITLPDGQGQTSQFAASSTDRIEVLKGPIAALYGNASGGVIQAFTREPSIKPEWRATGFVGSDDLYRSSVQYSETRGDYGLVLDYGALSSNGFREYSAAERHHVNAKLVRAHAAGKTSFIVNALNQTKSEDPGTLTKTQFDTNPYQAQGVNKTNRAGKQFVQSLAGLTHEQRLSDGSELALRGFVATRDLDNPGNGTTFILIDRLQWGLGAQWSATATAFGVPARVQLGAEFDAVADDRKARTNSSGIATGSITRDEDNLSSATGLYARADWALSDDWTLLTGLRWTSVTHEIKDRYFLEATPRDGSGSRTYSGLSPVVGLTRHLGANANVYVNVARSLEAPTLNEVLYRDSGTASVNEFNSLLSASRSDQLEVGYKARGDQWATQAAAFWVRTEDEVVPNRLSSFAANWQNVDTSRRGVEASYLRMLTKEFRLDARATYVNGRYEQAATIQPSNVPVASGNRLTNIPSSRISLDIAWSNFQFNAKASRGQEAALELQSVGRIFVKSDNAERTNPYSLVNLRYAVRMPAWGGRLHGFARANNLTNKKYASSTIGDQESLRFYEPGAPRNYLLGVNFTQSW